MSAALVDTSVWIARELGREVNLLLVPETVFVSVVTLGELQAGVLAAADTATRSQRLETVRSLAAIQPLPIDGALRNGRSCVSACTRPAEESTSTTCGLPRPRWCINYRSSPKTQTSMSSLRSARLRSSEPEMTLKTRKLTAAVTRIPDEDGPTRNSARGWASEQVSAGRERR